MDPLPHQLLWVSKTNDLPMILQLLIAFMVLNHRFQMSKRTMVQPSIVSIQLLLSQMEAMAISTMFSLFNKPGQILVLNISHQLQATFQLDHNKLDHGRLILMTDSYSTFKTNSPMRPSLT